MFIKYNYYYEHPEKACSPISVTPFGIVSYAHL